MMKTKLAAAALFALASSSAFAYDYTVRGGVIGINIHSESPDFTSNGPAFLTPQPAGLTVGNAKTLLFGLTKKLNDNFELDFVAGLPPEHEVYGRGVLAPYGVIARVKQRAPTVFVNYKFGAPSSSFRPFVGLGINYTQFFDAKTTPLNDIAVGGPTKLNLTSSFGLAAQVGATYQLNERWSVTASVATAKVKTDMTAITGSIERKTTVDFKPVVVAVGVGYSFW
ncbi:OmpW/AlkL family protein [Undibacterium crateris]|uniref:OmpW/AlkL family protein n=1 Tax=Undibacterium crateris TaxID=2528175 RepID=UPI00138A4484|nr:OmpW family outer membrane protein [Undibacterium crateris]NDI85941.1 outer membrane beta-barrel protein [Undibacterium crateris]